MNQSEQGPAPHEIREAEENLDDTSYPNNSMGPDGKSRLRELTEVREDALFEGKQRTKSELLASKGIVENVTGVSLLVDGKWEDGWTIGKVWENGNINLFKYKEDQPDTTTSTACSYDEIPDRIRLFNK